MQAAGPWLVKLNQSSNTTDRVFALVGDKPAAVFWCCDQGERVLWRHLRTLNMALILRLAVEGGSEPPADGSGQNPTPVMFRHWDPRVLGSLMPCIETAQFATTKISKDQMTPLSNDESYYFGRKALEAIDLTPDLGAFFKIDYLLSRVLCSAIFGGDFRDSHGSVSSACASLAIGTLSCTSLTEDALPSYRFSADHENLRTVREIYHTPSYVIADDDLSIIVVSDIDDYLGCASNARTISQVVGLSRNTQQEMEDIRPFLDGVNDHSRRVGKMLQGFHDVCRRSCDAVEASYRTP